MFESGLSFSCFTISHNPIYGSISVAKPRSICDLSSGNWKPPDFMTLIPALQPAWCRALRISVLDTEDSVLAAAAAAVGFDGLRT